MDEIVLVTAADANAMTAVDLGSSAPFCSFKACICDAGAVCLIGGASAYSGLGSCDYIAVAQAKKPVIHMYSWGRPQPLMQFHVQEISCSLASDLQGTLLLAGNRSGRITVWDIQSGALLVTWNAHFQAVSCLSISTCSSFVVSAADDGSVKVWDLGAVIDESSGPSSTSLSVGAVKTTLPFRTHSSHTLPVRGMLLLGSARCALRVVTCSLDRSVVVYDVFSASEVAKIAFPSAITSIACSATEDALYAGATDGKVYVTDFSERAIALSAAHAEVAYFGGGQNSHPSKTSLESTSDRSYMVIEAHTGSVTSLAMSSAGSILASISSDGTLKLWDTLTRQCLRETKPLGKAMLTNVLVLSKPEVMINAPHKPTLTPAAHVKKYTESSTLQCTMGPLLRGCYAQLQTLPQAGRSSIDAGENNPSRKRIRSTMALHAEYVALPGEGDKESADDATMLPSVHNESSQTIHDLQKALAELREENGRWKHVCMQLKAGVLTSAAK